MRAHDLSKPSDNGQGGQPKGWSLILPWEGKPKARPRVTENGTYMPKEYVEWKEAIAEYVRLQNLPTLVGPLSLLSKFYKDRIEVMVSEGAPPRYGQADVDNLSGGLMDALEDAGCYKNDIQIAQLSAQIIKEMKK